MENAENLLLNINSLKLHRNLVLVTLAIFPLAGQ